MGNVDKSASEKAYQENFVQEMTKYQWEAPEFLNGNTHKVTVNDLVNHWRAELNRINADQLEGVSLTDGEFDQVMKQVNKIDNSYEAAKILAIENSKGKIDGIYRDPNPQVTKNKVTLTIFKKAEVRGGDSSYKIAREVQTPNGNRFDIVLLINGLPLINIEQKRADINLNEAFEQFRRYYRDGEYTKNFMAFSQMMVLNSEIETRYFATPKTYQAFNPSFVFHWADQSNKPINHYKDAIKHFLMIPMAHQMVGDYLVVEAAEKEEEQKHMLMRPYQVYALQCVEGAAFGWDNPEKKPHGGYVWHTTGSGKTITSFKTALFLSTRAGFDKVVFLVDRRELDKKTRDDFKAYAVYEAEQVDDTKTTSILERILKEGSTGIVVTTTFKLNSLVKKLIDTGEEGLLKKKFVFIIDEAHRTTMGDMMVTIKSYFKNNGLFFGFTGTPLFEENDVQGKINEKSEVIDTTEKLFGPELHSYTIDEAIGDRNVLGFHVDYINTGEFESYDKLRELMIEKIKQEKPNLSDRVIEQQVSKMTKAELERENLFKYQDETHIPRVVTEILENWEHQSRHNVFNALLTVEYKKRVIAYYNEFKKQLKERDQKLNIAMTVSFGNENDPSPIDPTFIQEIFQDYAAYTGIEFIVGDKKRGEDAYFEDLVTRAKSGGSARNPKNIDLVIVADQLLTGYDSKLLNTLYVDRRLELHGLIQAYSRTNRIYGHEKEFGTIVNFKYPAITENDVDIALKLYGSGGKSSRVIMDTYEVAVQRLASFVPDLFSALSDPADWQSIKDDKEKKKAFTDAFKAVANQLNVVEQYYEFSWDDGLFGITEHNFLQYVGAYKNIARGDNETPPADEIVPLTGKSRLVTTQEITASYIISLIGSKVVSSSGVLTVDGETLRIIHEQIQELSTMGEYEQAMLLKEFVDCELVKGHISENHTFDEAYEIWKQEGLKKEVSLFAQEWGIDGSLLLKSVNGYSSSQQGVIPYIDDIITTLNFDSATNKSAGNLLMHNLALMEALPQWVAGVRRKFGLF